MSKVSITLLTLSLLLLLTPSIMAAQESDANISGIEIFRIPAEEIIIEKAVQKPVTLVPDTAGFTTELKPYQSKGALLSVYELPYSINTTCRPDWHRLWINSAVIATAYVGTLGVLECLPEDATTWNRAALQKTPPFTRWYQNVFKKGPEWDHDNPVFNFLHPYAGAVYFMMARSCGFNFWRSLLYCSIVSNIGWEFGIEAFMERPSYQDLIITPVVGSLLGECFYMLKRHIVSHDYTLFGNRILGNVVVFLIDPVNEVVGLFDGNRERRLHLGRKPKVESALMPATMPGGGFGFTLSCRF